MNPSRIFILRPVGTTLLALGLMLLGMGAALGAGTGAKDPVAADARPTGIAIPGAAPAIGGGGGALYTPPLRVFSAIGATIVCGIIAGGATGLGGGGGGGAGGIGRAAIPAS